GFALQKLHDDEVNAVLLAEVVELANVGVAEVRDGARFALKTVTRRRLSRELRRKNLDSDRTIETLVDRAINLAHPACADRRDDLVRPKFCAGGKRHVEQRGL